MKKLLALILAMCMTASFTACGDSDDDDKDRSSSSKSETQIAISYEKALDNYFKAMEKGDADLYKKCILPCRLDYLKSADSTFDEDEYCEKLADAIFDELEDDYGDNLKITYEVKDEKELSKNKLDDIKSDIKDKYDAEVAVEKGYKVKLKAKIKGNEDEEDDTMTIEVAMINGEWYIVDGNMF